MTLRLVQTVLDSTDARRSAEFWRQLLGLTYREGHEPPRAGEDDPEGRDWLNLLAADGRTCLAFQQTAEVKRSTWPRADVPQQLHLDLAVDDVAELDAVHELVLSLGGTVLLDRSQDEGEPLRAYGDPDGHPFCVFVS